MFLVTSCYRNRDKLWPDGPLTHMQTLLPAISRAAVMNYFCFSWKFKNVGSQTI